MKSNNINALRDHLFEVIERLKLSNDPDADEKEKMDIPTAKAITEAAHVIVESSKMEVDLLRVMAKSGEYTFEQLTGNSEFLLPQKTKS